MININDYKKNDGIKILLDINSEKDLTIINLRKREIELLRVILNHEESITNLIKYISENIDLNVKNANNTDVKDSNLNFGLNDDDDEEIF